MAVASFFPSRVDQALISTAKPLPPENDHAYSPDSRQDVGGGLRYVPADDVRDAVLVNDGVALWRRDHNLTIGDHGFERADPVSAAGIDPAEHPVWPIVLRECEINLVFEFMVVRLTTSKPIPLDCRTFRIELLPSVTCVALMRALMVSELSWLSVRLDVPMLPMPGPVSSRFVP